MRALNRTRGLMLADRGAIAASPWSRLRGLLWHPPLEPGEALLLRGEKAIHTVGMGFAIDVLFLDRTGRVVHLMPSVVPFRFSPLVMAAADVLELPSGTLAETGTRVGDQIDIA